jgi:hypothetical protein
LFRKRISFDQRFCYVVMIVVASCITLRSTERLRVPIFRLQFRTLFAGDTIFDRRPLRKRCAHMSATARTPFNPSMTAFSRERLIAYRV